MFESTTASGAPSTILLAVEWARQFPQGPCPPCSLYPSGQRTQSLETWAQTLHLLFANNFEPQFLHLEER